MIISHPRVCKRRQYPTWGRKVYLKSKKAQISQKNRNYSFFLFLACLVCAPFPIFLFIFLLYVLLIPVPANLQKYFIFHDQLMFHPTMHCSHIILPAPDPWQKNGHLVQSHLNHYDIVPMGGRLTARIEPCISCACSFFS